MVIDPKQTRDYTGETLDIRSHPCTKGTRPAHEHRALEPMVGQGHELCEPR